MGNCFPFFSFVSRNGDDLTTLNNLSDDRSLNSQISRQGSRSDASRTRSSRRRSHQPSSYVNELYINLALRNDDVDESIILDEKRKLRVRGLLEQIPIEVYVKNRKGNNECAICMFDFDANDKIRYLPCMHSYHVECIDDWLLRSFTCPSCMEPVDSAILSAFTVNSTNVNLLTLTCAKEKLETLGSNK